MNETFQKIIEIIDRNREDGFEVSAVRVGTEDYYNLFQCTGFINRGQIDDFHFEYERTEGLVGNTEVIVDDSISGVVVEDVRGLWRDE